MLPLDAVGFFRSYIYIYNLFLWFFCGSGFLFFLFFYCSTKYTAYMKQIIYIHTRSIQRIKKTIIIMVSYNYVYTSIITISVTCINEKSIYR